MDRQTLQERVGLYSLLHVLYTYPLTEPVLETVVDLSLEADSPLATGRHVAQMQARLRTNGALPATVDALNVEMTRLLEGPGQTPAPPYASYYLHGGRLMGPSALAARRAYLNWQVVPDSDSRIPDDHITLELGFLAHLARLAGEAETRSDRLAALVASRDFLRHHLLPWLPRFCAALNNTAVDPFFAGLAGFTQAAVEADLDWLTAVLAETPAETTPAVSAC